MFPDKLCSLVFGRTGPDGPTDENRCQQEDANCKKGGFLFHIFHVPKSFCRVLSHPPA